MPLLWKRWRAPLRKYCPARFCTVTDVVAGVTPVPKCGHSEFRVDTSIVYQHAPRASETKLSDNATTSRTSERDLRAVAQKPHGSSKRQSADRQSCGHQVARFITLAETRVHIALSQSSNGFPWHPLGERPWQHGILQHGSVSIR